VFPTFQSYCEPELRRANAREHFVFS